MEIVKWFHELLSQLSYAVSLENPGALAVLFFLGFLADVGIPLLFILEIFLFFISYHVGPLSAQVVLAVLMLLLGNECGAALLYWLSRLLGRRLIDGVAKRFSWLRKNLEQLEDRLSRRTILATVIVRLTPGLLQMPSLAAGAMRLRYFSFFMGVAISALIYDFGLVLSGYLVRIGLKNVGRDTEIYLVIAAAVLLAIAWIVLFFTLRRSPRR